MNGHEGVKEFLKYYFIFLLILSICVSLMLSITAAVIMAILLTLGIYLREKKEVARNLLKRVGRNVLLIKGWKVEDLTKGLLLTYLLVLTIKVITSRIVIVPDQMLFYGVVGAFLFGNWRGFLGDWIPFALLWVAYDAMRGLAYSHSMLAQAHYVLPIELEMALFRSIPTIEMQRALFRGVAWYDYFFTLVYAMHFTAPFLFAFYLWILNRRAFKEFTSSIILVSYLGLITFILLPVAPPWLAAKEGFLPHVEKILFNVTKCMGFTTFPTLYLYVSANPVAAIPSLHAAYPMLILLCAYKYWRRKRLKFALPLLLLSMFYSISMNVSIVYLGEHYFVDALIAVPYVLFSFYFVEWWVRKK